MKHTNIAGALVSVLASTGCQLVTDFSHESAVAGGGSESEAGGSSAVFAGGKSSKGGTSAKGGTSSKVSAKGGVSANDGTAGANAIGGTTAVDGTAGASAIGGTAEPGGSANTTGGSTADTVVPRVVSVLPVNGASGVPSSQVITIGFSEPMEKESVASAISVTGYLRNELTLEWNSDGTTLSVTPVGGLKYAEGTNANPVGTPAKTYVVSIGTTARDTTMNDMGTAFSSSFSTLRRITQTLPDEKSLSYTSSASGGGATTCNAPGNLNVGGWSGPYSGGDYWAFAVFDVTPLGAIADKYAIEAAKFSGHQISVTSGFYAGHEIKLAKIKYYSANGVSGYYDVYMNEVTDELGTFASSEVLGNSGVSILTAFKADFASGTERQIYRLTPNGTVWQSEQYASFACGAFGLTVTYVIK